MKSSKIWFVPKKYGYGYIPVTWQGWLMTAKYVIGLVLIAFTDGLVSLSQNGGVITSWQSADVLRLILDFALWTAIFMLFVFKYSEGELKWRWGDSN